MGLNDSEKINSEMDGRRKEEIVPQAVSNLTTANIDPKLVRLIERLEKVCPDHKAYAMDSIGKTLRKDIEYYAKAHGKTVEEVLAGVGFETTTRRDDYELRPTSIVVDDIIVLLKAKYANGPIYEKLSDLMSDNPELEENLKIISNKANELLGTSLKDYLVQQGILLEESVREEKEREEAIRQKELAMQRRLAPRKAKNDSIREAKEKQEETAKIEKEQEERIHQKELTEAGLLLAKEKKEHRVFEIQLFTSKVIFVDAVDGVAAVDDYVSVEINEGKIYGRVTGIQLISGDICENVKTLKRISRRQICNEVVDENPFEAGTILNEILGMFTVSADGKEITGYDKNKNCIKDIVCIPRGIERISDNAFHRVKIKTIYIPNTLLNIGKYTLKDQYGDAKSGVERVFVEDGNSAYSSDELGFYSILSNGKKQLELLWGKNITEFIVPNDVVSFASGVFENQKDLTQIKLHNEVECFNENALSRNTILKSIFIPAGVKHIIPRSDYFSYDYVYDWPNLISYVIDENNENLFEDEDSIYEVLEDGSFKLLTCRYYGKGRALVLEGTSEIGDFAFFGCNGIGTLDLPETVRKIGCGAFGRCAFKKVSIPENVDAVGSKAFKSCKNLASVDFANSDVSISSDIFDDCWYLKTVTVKGKTGIYEYDQGQLIKIENSVTPMIGEKTTSDVAKSKLEDINYVEQMANIFLPLIEKLAVSKRGHEADAAVFDREKNELVMEIALSQQTNDAVLAQKRVNAAETMSVGDELTCRVSTYGCWEFFTKSGVSIADDLEYLWYYFKEYGNFVDMKAYVASVTPKSQRKKTIKYALISVKLVITNRTDLDSIDYKDRQYMSMYSYTETSDGKIEISSVKKAYTGNIIIPAEMFGKKVIVNRQMFEKVPVTGRELIFEEGIEKIGQLFELDVPKFKRMVFPASVKSISKKIFGDYPEKHILQEIEFSAPADSYALSFLQNIDTSKWRMDRPLYVTVLGAEKSEESTGPYEDVSKYLKYENENGLFAGCSDDLGKKLIGDTLYIPEEYAGKTVTGFKFYGIPKKVKKLILSKNISHFEKIFGSDSFFKGSLGGSYDITLESIEIAEENEHFWTDGMAIYSKDKSHLIWLISTFITEYDVLDGTKIIDEYAFVNRQNLVKVTLPESVDTIGTYAFGNCPKLSEIVGVDRVRNIKDYAFIYTKYEETNEFVILNDVLVKFNNYASRKVVVPEGVIKIAKEAFGAWRDDSIEEIVLPNSLKTIEEGSFSHRSTLKRINIPNGVKELPDSIFRECKGLEEIFIPESIEVIGKCVFPSRGTRNKDGLKRIVVDENNQYYTSRNGILYSKDMTRMICVPSCLDSEELIIPEGVQVIENDAASSMMQIKKISFPSTLVKIKTHAFHGCTNVKELIFPDSLQKIAKYAFFECVGVERIKFGVGLKRIGERAFNGTSITEIVLPEGLEYVGGKAFAKTGLKSVVVPKTVNTVGCGAFFGCETIEIFDSIDPNANNCYDKLDFSNGSSKSTVGYIGSYEMWEYNRINYEIIVRSSETGEIKYKVWMGAKSTQEDYCCLLSSSWGKNATFAFTEIDEFFPNISGKDNKMRIAKNRLEYPIELTQDKREMYEEYLEKKSREEEG